MINLRLFARFREDLGLDSEQFETADISCVEDLLRQLRLRGGAWSRLLAEDQRIMIAVNQEMANTGTPLSDGDEVALFPPVTGG
jgi:sulfur-carrier protein